MMQGFRLIAGTAAAVLALAGTSGFAHDHAPQTGGKAARCAITTNGGNYTGPCQFSSDSTGSFVITLASGAPLFGEVVNIGMYIQSPGVANATVVITSGLTQQWGQATRSKTDSACWSGDGFTVCAY